MIPNMLKGIEHIHLRSMKHLSGYLDRLIKGKLWIKVLVAMVAGILFGILIGPSTGWVPKEIAQLIGNWVSLPGYLFLALVQMIVIPLIFSSIIRGLAASEDVSMLKNTGLKAVLYFLVTTVIAILIGMALASWIKPGTFIDSSLIRQMSAATLPEAGAETFDMPGLAEIPSTIVGVLPSNPMSAMVQTEMLQIVIFAVFIGLALLAMPADKSRPLLDLLGSLQEVCMTVVRWAMLLAPLAVFGLLANLTSTVGLDVLLGMAVYVGTVISGLLILLVMYLILVAFAGKLSPLHFMKSAKEVMLLAFSTSSSAAVMPLSIQTADQELKVRPSVSQFIIPLGATINMNGTALYQGVATVFLAQVYGVDLSLAAMAFVVVTAVSASIGAPATPGVGIVILATILQGVGIPAGGVALIIGVDRILDMSRTAVNVTGDLSACVIMDRWAATTSTAEEQLEQEKELEKERQRSGEDLIEKPA